MKDPDHFCSSVNEVCRRLASLCLLALLATSHGAVRVAAAEAAVAHPAPVDAHRLTVLDTKGRAPIKDFQVIAGVPSSVGDRDAKKVVNWQPHTLRQGREGELLWPLNRAYDEMALRIEADGYAPQMVSWIKRSAGARSIVLELAADKGTAGRVLTPDGAPAAGAVIALAMVQRDATLEGGLLRHLDEPPPQRPSDRWRWPRFTRADDQGRFQLPPESDPTAALLVVHDLGVRELALAAFQQKPEVELQPWGRIEGQVQWGRVADSNRTVALSVYRDGYGYPGVIAQSERTTTAEDGAFTFERVLPGQVQISAPIRLKPGGPDDPGEMNLSPLTTHATIKPGNNRVLLGGQGRTVRGRLVGQADWTGVTFHFHPTAPHIGFPGDDEMWKTWGALQNSPAGQHFFRTGLKVNPDGSFEMTGVLPGDFQIFFSRPGGKEHLVSSRFTVPPEAVGVKPEAHDMGEIPLRAGQ